MDKKNTSYERLKTCYPKRLVKELTKDLLKEPNLRYPLKKGRNDQIVDVRADRPAIFNCLQQNFQKPYTP